MIFTVKIDGKDVEMSNAFLWQIKYKSQFKEDPAIILMDAMEAATKSGRKGGNASVYAAVRSVGFIRLAGMLWAMAKAADPSIPAPNIWEAQFEDFKIFDVGVEALGYAIDGITETTETPKNAETPGTAQTPAEE